MAKMYRLHCEICGYTKITDGSDVQLYELKTSAIPRNIPKFDPESKKVTETKFKNQPKKLRCPGCGRVVIPREVSDPQYDANQKRDMEKRKERIDEENRTIRSEASTKRPKIQGYFTNTNEAGTPQVP